MRIHSSSSIIYSKEKDRYKNVLIVWLKSGGYNYFDKNCFFVLKTI